MVLLRLSRACLVAAVGCSVCLGADKQAPQPQAKPAFMAVNQLQSHGLAEGEAATLTEVLRSDLMQTGKFRVMERSEMEGILKEQAFQQSGACTEDACIVEMGQILGIDQIVAGSIGKVGQAYSVNLRLISVATGEILRSVSHSYTGPVEGLLTSEIGIVARKLSGDEPVMPARRSKRSLKPVFIGLGVGVAVIGGGAAAFVLLKGDNSGEPAQTPAGVADKAQLEVTW